MPRFSRPMPGGLCAHIVTRGNARARVFHCEDDYELFSGMMEAACARIAVELFAWCLMPNHVHFVVRPRADGDLSRWMHWLLTTHVQRHRIRHETTGRIWQGRYKAFPIQADTHLLTVLRYVERNPLRAGLVRSSREWRWSSVPEREGRRRHADLLAPSPVPLPSPWLEWVDSPLTATELANVRASVRRERPLGDSAWTRGMSERLGLVGTLRPRGRPRNL
jgi:putative transposase